MARSSFECLGLTYHGDAVQVFHVVYFRGYQRTAHDFRGSVLQLVNVGLIMLKYLEYDSLRLKVNGSVTSIHIVWVLESTVFL